MLDWFEKAEEERFGIRSAPSLSEHTLSEQIHAITDQLQSIHLGDAHVLDLSDLALGELYDLGGGVERLKKAATAAWPRLPATEASDKANVIEMKPSVGAASEGEKKSSPDNFPRPRTAREARHLTVKKFNALSAQIKTISERLEGVDASSMAGLDRNALKALQDAARLAEVQFVVRQGYPNKITKAGDKARAKNYLALHELVALSPRYSYQALRYNDETRQCGITQHNWKDILDDCVLKGALEKLENEGKIDAAFARQPDVCNRESFVGYYFESALIGLQYYGEMVGLRRPVTLQGINGGNASAGQDAAGNAAHIAQAPAAEKTRPSLSLAANPPVDYMGERTMALSNQSVDKNSQKYKLQVTLLAKLLEGNAFCKELQQRTIDKIDADQAVDPYSILGNKLPVVAWLFDPEIVADNVQELNAHLAGVDDMGWRQLFTSRISHHLAYGPEHTFARLPERTVAPLEGDSSDSSQLANSSPTHTLQYSPPEYALYAQLSGLLAARQSIFR